MSDASERLKQARIRAGFDTAADAAAYLGVSPPTYASHENGSRGVTASRARDYARSFRVDPEWILYGKGEIGSDPVIVAPRHEDGEADLVSVYDVQASAGDGVVIYDEERVAQLAFPQGYLNHLTRARATDLAIISVKGDSMHPTLADDDIVMIDLTKKDLSYDGLFVIRDGGSSLLVKRIGRASRSGHISLISDNRAIYPTVERSTREIEVVGRVIWRGGKL